MVSCGNSNTGSKDDDLSVLDLLLQQDNFGSDYDQDGIDDDFGGDYKYTDSSSQPLETKYNNGECKLDVLSEEQIKEEINNFELKQDDNPEEPVQPPVLRGCTDPKAENYDPNASQDDGSCVFLSQSQPNTTPIPDPLLPDPEPFLSKEDASKLITKRGYYYPKSHGDFVGGPWDSTPKGPMNPKKFGEGGKYGFIPYHSVANDGGDGYFRYICMFNYTNAEWWIPRATPINVATKYWRNGGKDNINMQESTSTGSPLGRVKDGMYTAGLCKSVEKLWIHFTGCADSAAKPGNYSPGVGSDPILHMAGAPCKDTHRTVKGVRKPPCSAFPYNWAIKYNGHVAQMAPDWRYMAHTGHANNKRGVALSWMCGATPSPHGKGADLPDNGIVETGTISDFNGHYRGFFPTAGQIISIGKLCAIYIKRYPNILIGGHNQASSKACPMFWVPEWMKAGGIPGLDQAGIDKHINPADKYDNDPRYAENSFLGVAARELAKLSNPAGVGGGSAPSPNSNSNSPVSADVDSFGNSVEGSPNFKDFNDMDCNEFKTFYYNIRNNGPRSPKDNLIAFSSGLDIEGRSDFDDKTFNCQDLF
jgi:hypothetical protein